MCMPLIFTMYQNLRLQLGITLTFSHELYHAQDVWENRNAEHITVLSLMDLLYL